MSVLIHRRRELAETHIKHLEDARADVAERWNNLQHWATEVTGKKHDAAVLETIRGTSNTVTDIENAVVRFWIHSEFCNFLPIKPDAYRTAFKIPLKVSNLIDATMNVHTSDRIIPYPEENGIFQPLPVTDEEREGIYARAEIRVATEDDAELYRSVEKVVNLANLRNRTKTGVEMSIGDLTTGPNAIYQGLILKLPKGDHPLDPVQFGVNHDAFNRVRTEFKAVNEGRLKLD